MNFKNRLGHEKSPYLLQHAHNPIDWYPWGEEAFAKAKAEDKPIFLSIGYATCHWCHVMEKESFANPQLAGLMNDVFINIKVDREEHPEVDSMYMEMAQALLSGGGGWPLNLVLTPDLKPFFACTYLPPSTVQGVLGLKEFTQQVAQLWKSEEKGILLDQADKVVDVLANLNFPVSSDLPVLADLKHAMEELFEQFDPVYGGIKSSQKFPMAYLYELLLIFGKKQQDSRALFLSNLSLDKILEGGIHDHLGGGFSRYCVDEAWHFPHFEKMLGDNALLFLAYLEAFRSSGKQTYLEACHNTLNYILRVLKAPEGGFFSAQDADSQGREGYYYTWGFKEVQDHLSPEVFAVLSSYYNLSEKGNFEDRNVLFTEYTLEKFAEAINMPLSIAQTLLEEGKKTLFDERSKRAPPFLDDKIILSWNGLMLEVLAKAGLFFDKRYLAIAEQTAVFLKNSFIKEEKLLRRFREQEIRFSANLDDYAFLIRGLLSLFEAAGNADWLEWALNLSKYVEEHFRSEEGSFYLTDNDSTLVLRRSELVDGSEPCGNALQTENLLRLYQITLDDSFKAAAEQGLKASFSIMEKYPAGAGYHLKALQRYVDKKAYTMVIALDEEESGKEEINSVLAKLPPSHLSIVWKRAKDTKIAQLIPSLVDKTPLDGQTTVYLCNQEGCLPPLLDIAKLTEILHAL